MNPVTLLKNVIDFLSAPQYLVTAALIGLVLLIHWRPVWTKKGGIALFALLGNIALARSGHASDATNWKQAESEARSALGLVPWSAEPDRELAVAQAGLGQIAAARDSLRDAVDREPRDWSLWYQLSEVTTGAEHRRALAQANRLNPNRTSGEATPGDLRLVLIP